MISKIITSEQVNYDFNKLKSSAIMLFNQNKIDQALKTIEVAGELMYNFNIKYMDEDLENLIVSISEKILGDKANTDRISQGKNKIIFYDYFSLDNRGLTQQYLRALMDLKYEILYITYESSNKKSSNIVKELNDYGNSRIYYIRNKDYIKACIELYNVIMEYDSAKVMIHTSPSDIVGVTTFAALKGKVTRYFINITDHAFWLGKCSADYFIEFRSYGFNISANYRGIDKAKLIILPYYPIQDYEQEFQGFPFDAKEKKVIFSGGSLYKIYGSDIFLNTIKYVLDKHMDAIFLYVGNGDAQPLTKFIAENGFENRFFYMTERKDITQVFRRCYFYLGTYPTAGGLMPQYAALNGKIPISYANKEESRNFIESLFINTSTAKFTYTDIEKFHEEIDKLMLDSKYLTFRESQLVDLIITEEVFSEELGRCINNQKTRFIPQPVEINKKEIYTMYLDLENNYLKKYSEIFVKRNYLKLGLVFPKNVIQGVCKKVFRNIKKKIRRMMRWLKVK